MAKLEYKPITSWDVFNFVGKRLYDFINVKLNATTGTYVGNGSSGREIKVDIIPRMIMIVPVDSIAPAFWLDGFIAPNSKLFDGTILTDGILGLNKNKSGFIVGDGVSVNASPDVYNYIVFGS